MIYADRDLRQRDLLPPEALSECTATVIGVGAVGRQVALQLAAVGVPSLELIDHDIVEPVNLAAQGYLEADLGQLKVEATASMCRQINSSIEVVARAERFRRSRSQVGQALFCCVDSIDTRKIIWESVKGQVKLFVDDRMNALVIRLLTAADPETRDHYPSTLFPGSEAHVGSCTARSTIFTANICAGLMVSQFSRWLRKMPVDGDLTLNLAAGEMGIT